MIQHRDDSQGNTNPARPGDAQRARKLVARIDNRAAYGAARQHHPAGGGRQRLARYCAGDRRAAARGQHMADALCCPRPRPGAKPVYTEATDKRILAMLDQPIPKGRARWTCELIAEALGDVDVNYVWLRNRDRCSRTSFCARPDRSSACARTVAWVLRLSRMTWSSLSG
jgi:hypothetical protein